MIVNGFIRKINAGLYDVFAEGKNYLCVARGKLRLNDESPRVGDYVTIDVISASHPSIQTILPRTNQLIRPAIANVDQVVVVTSLIEPEVDHSLLLRFIMLAQVANIPVIVVFNKADLPNYPQDQFEVFKAQLDKHHIQAILTSSVTEEGMPLILSLLASKRSVFTGQSGVGKTSLLNKINPNLTRQTGAISKALGRGKHITRFSEFVPIGDGWVADTPGFSSIEFNIDPQTLAQRFLGFADYVPHCKFRGCLHHHEPQCAVKKAVENGIIEADDYQVYLDLLDEVQNKKETY